MAALGGCGARTGLRTPDVPTDIVDDDVAPPPTDFCIDLDPDAGVLTVNLETQPQLSVADVFFLVDRTGSMTEEIDNIKANLQTTIVPAIARAIGDVQFGVATYGDFPLHPYGEDGDIPFTMVSPIDRSVSNVQGAVNSIRVGGGGDNAEAMTEALFQVASGEGYSPWITSRAACAVPGRQGYPCFRPNAQPIVVLVTDAPAHNGPQADNAYDNALFLGSGGSRVPHSYTEMINAARATRLRVLGINSGVSPFWGRDDLSRIAVDTGAVTSTGTPLVFDIGDDGRELDTRVVSAIETFTRQVRFDASARVLDVDPMRPATPLVRAVRPVSASPSVNVQRIEGDTFYGVIPGTRLTFALELQATVPRTNVPQRFPARVQFYAGGRANLGARDIVIVIPALDGAGCNAAPDAGTDLDASR